MSDDGCHTIAGILRRYKSIYFTKYERHIPRLHYKVIDSLVSCRTPVLGGHRYTCDTCGREHVVYNSCRNRHCPTCGQLETAKWLLKRRTEILPIRYFHVVFTVPEELNPVFLQNQRIMYNLLFASVAKTIVQLTRDPEYLGVNQTGFISVLHTWSQTLTAHPHIHSIVLGGGISKDKKNWMSCKKDYFMPVDVMSGRFRRVFLDGLKVLYRNNKLRFEGKQKELRWRNVFRKLLDKVFGKRWVVHCEPNHGRAEKIFDYIGRYIQRVAISNQRIITIRNDRVFFRYKDYSDKGKMKVMDLDSYEFIRRFLLHVLPPGFVKIRYYGILGFRNREEKIRLCRKLIGVPDVETGKQEIPSSTSELYEMVTGKPIDLCPYCKKGKLMYVEEIPRLQMERGP